MVCTFAKHSLKGLLTFWHQLMVVCTGLCRNPLISSVLEAYLPSLANVEIFLLGRNFDIHVKCHLYSMSVPASDEQERPHKMSLVFWKRIQIPWEKNYLWFSLGGNQKLNFREET